MQRLPISMQFLQRRELLNKPPNKRNEGVNMALPR